MLTLRRIFVSLFFLYALLTSAMSYALPFSIVPKAHSQLPTSVNAGFTAAAYYTVTNNTQSQRNNNYMKYPLKDASNISQVIGTGTYGDTCGATFNLAPAGQPGSSCTLQLTISGPVNSNDPNPHNHLFVCFPGGVACAGTNYPLNVTQNSSTPPNMYLTVFSTLGNPNNVFYCPVNSGGSIGVCNVTANGFSFVEPISINLNPTKTFAYIADVGTAIIYYCPINANGSLGTCNPITGQVSFNDPSGIAFNTANGFAYVADSGNSEIFYCGLNSDGSFSNCLTAFNGLNFPISIAINAAGTYAYISTGTLGNPNNTMIAYCTFNNDKTLNCNNTSQIGNNILSVAVNPMSTYVYVADNQGAFQYCPLNANGSINTSACQNIALPAGDSNAPIGVTVNSNGTVIYLTDINFGSSTGNLYYCALNGDGSVNSSTCTITSSGIPIGDSPFAPAVSS